MTEPEHPEQPWMRLDKRMLLVHPITEAVKMLPVLIASLFIGTQSGNHFFGLIALAVIVAFAIGRWFTTSYRIGPTNIELRTGLLERKKLSIPRSRIRSVDVEANLMHRILGLSVVRIGTGTGKSDEKFELNALAEADVPALRQTLLQNHAPIPDAVTGDAPQTREIAHFSLGWVRFAPFSSSGVIAVAAIIGLVFQYGLGEKLAESQSAQDIAESATVTGIVIAAILGLVLLLVIASVAACVFYLLLYGNLQVIDDGRVLHVSHGVLKTRQVSLDRKRLRGTTAIRPLLIRLVGGGRLDAIMTGVSAGKKESSLVLPLAPFNEVTRASADLTGAELTTTPLRHHGPAARRRRFTRALLPVAVVTMALGIVAVFVHVPPLVWGLVAVIAIAASALAWDRYRGLGHATPHGWLITQYGSLDRRRHSIQAPGIIGWTVRQSFFQRRAGVATIVAATPAGRGHYEVIDVPADQAWSLIAAVQPGAGDRWARQRIGAGR